MVDTGRSAGRLFSVQLVGVKHHRLAREQILLAMADEGAVGNRYYICSGQPEQPIPWEPWEDLQESGATPAYLNKVAASMALNLDVSGLVFYFTWNTRRLPSYGPNVVAVVLGDESCRIPWYFDKIHSIFKCYGTKLPAANLRLAPGTAYKVVTLLHLGENWLQRLPSALHFHLQRARACLRNRRLRPNIYEIPIGYANQLDLPIKEISVRAYDVYFAGSVDHESYRIWSPKYWLGTPKSLSRSQMVASVNQLARQHPEYKIKLSITTSFRESRKSDPDDYSHDLMDAKVCLVPRGASPETYRFFEAMRYGCVIVTERLPRRWFYDGSPALEISDWGDLRDVISGLLDEETLERMHRASLQWWNSRCSEAAVGAYMATILNEATGTARCGDH